MAKLGKDSYGDLDERFKNQPEPKTFEEKMERRAAWEANINREPVFNLNGGSFSRYGCMSLKEYKTKAHRQELSKIKEI